MKKLLLTLAGGCLLVALSAGCGNSQDARYQRYLEEVQDSNGVEFIPQVKDTINVEGEADDAEWLDDDDEGLMAIPDIPQERSVNMSASDYEVMREFSGKGGAE